MMKAMVCTKYGSPDVLQLQEVEKPVPKNDEVFPLRLARRSSIFYA
jgi:NADPH:quinone reductase-like Zn-dependent oxidoreductase